jgi:hypothetical protein
VFRGDGEAGFRTPILGANNPSAWVLEGFI